MKKFIVVLLIVVCALPFYSCEKEGVYNPKKKIERIYEQYPGSSKQLSQIWNWDKNKLLSIDHYSSDGTLSWVENYEYDGKRISTIADYKNYEKTVFTYNGNKIEKIEYWEENALEESYSFAYKGNKISSYTITFFGLKAQTQHGRELVQSSLQLFLPERGIELVQKSCSNIANTKGESVVVDIEWDGNNIEEMSCFSENYTLSFQYDDKKNPFCGFYDLEGLDPAYQSRNNITRITYSADGYYGEESYSYIYEGKYPVQGRDDNNHITFYEYLK